jgi:hypothetical protein
MNDIQEKLKSFQRDLTRNGMSTFYHNNGLIFISDFLKEVEVALTKKKKKLERKCDHIPKAYPMPKGVACTKCGLDLNHSFRK